MIEPLRQDQAYHDFADDRTLLGVTNGLDTLSSLAFVLVGVAGLWMLWRQRGTALRFEHPSEPRPWWLLFAAVAATGIGSIYYHQAPDDARLVWDRLPM
ncbi:MAG: alkaline phytoceramidase, partial [Halofilum sp. (in: g-proteobacteria)]|nr:alkaline phytoceramidase [Halofilum sp. (in: g-proteobacteria)]